MKMRMLWIVLLFVFTVPFWGAGSVARAKTIPINEKHFMDYYLRAYIKLRFDTNKDGKLSEKERNAVTEIDVGESSEYRLDLEFPSPGALDGIEYFPKLKKLYCSQGGLYDIDVSRNLELEELDCSDNYLKELDIKKNKKLKVLYCTDNKIKKLDVSNNTKLQKLFCSDNKIKKLNLKQNKNMKELLVSVNYIKSLNVRNLLSLTGLWCGENQLKKLDVTHNRKLITLECDTNKLTSLDVSKNKKLDYLHCGNNRISKLDLSKNKLLQTFRCEGNRMITGNVKLAHTQLDRCEAASQKATVKRKKIGKYYYIPLPGVLSTNVISNLSYGKITPKGIRVSKTGMPKTITYEYNMFTDGEEKTKVTIKTKK